MSSPWVWSRGVSSPWVESPWVWAACASQPGGTEPGSRGLNGGQKNLSFAPIRPGDVITSVATLVDAYEKDGRLGTMLFLIDESRWTNQSGDLVRIGIRTSIYY